MDVVPEGDTVWLACQRLNQALGGQPLSQAELRVPQLATVDLVGVVVDAVVSRGKHQLIRFSNATTLHTHLRMEGSWRIYPPGRALTGGPEHEIRVLLGNQGATVAGFRLPVVELLATAEEDSVVGHLGPDLLGPGWDLDEALRRIRFHPERTIGEALLDQRNLAGIGTLYRSEVLFLQGLHPRTPVEQVPDLRRVCVRARQLLMANRERGHQATTGDLRRGRQHYVFERNGQPCRRCRTTIQTEEFGTQGQERRSYWCPHCQPERNL